MSNSSPKRFIPRIVACNEMYIYAGPCEKCPSTIRPWIQQFVKLPGNEWYVEIDLEWAGDWFNNQGLSELFPNFDLSLEMITDCHSKDWKFLNDDDIASIMGQSKQLYGLLHARYITQPRGLGLMKIKYEEGLFGKCPRWGCKGAPLIPIGTTARQRHHTVKLFCPNCRDIYTSPPDIKIDGAHFGPTFPHVFLSQYSQFDLCYNFQKVPITAFGFEVCHKGRLSFHPHDNNKHRIEYPQIEE